ncbi:unnamed protein product [Litomosoides sigmodontis]|uniref:Uncharacterized protein n=1 Tax=Litomosoides sigmodontis TaxID=42156 RepID=A0A3P6TJK9_LITSI|nr:unnamed protein product [Litomosoides sigmodontis]
MYHAFNKSEADSFEDYDAIAGNMVLQGLIKMSSSVTSTEAPAEKPEVVLALTIILVILIIILIISIFLLLYCVLKRQGEKDERKKYDYERKRQQMEKSKTVLTDSARKAKVSQIAASIEAAVKSAENTSKLPKSDRQVTAAPPPPTPPLGTKSTSKKIPQATPHTQVETTVETPSLFMNKIFVHRLCGQWQQVDNEPSDFSYELESDSINDDIYLRPL